MSNKSDKPRGLSGIAGLNMGAAALADAVGQGLHRVIPTADIHIQEDFNPRGRYDPGAFSSERLRGLTESIQAEGILNPLWVRPNSQGGYILIAGERRLHAANRAQLRQVPALIFQTDERRAAYLAIIENGQRENLSLLDETFEGFRLLESHTGLSTGEVVLLLNQVRKGAPDVHGVDSLLRGTYGTGVSVWSQTRARILNFTPAELDAVREKHIDVSVVHELVPLRKDPQRQVLLKKSIDEGLNSRQVRTLVASILERRSSTGIKQDVSTLRSNLSKLAKLKGDQALQAQELIQKLQNLLERQ